MMLYFLRKDLLVFVSAFDVDHWKMWLWRKLQNAELQNRLRPAAVVADDAKPVAAANVIVAADVAAVVVD